MKHGIFVPFCSNSKSVYLVDEVNEKVISKFEINKYTTRTCTCGQLTLTNVGFPVVLCGWLEFQRLDRFIILRDAYGQTQCILKNNVSS